MKFFENLGKAFNSFRADPKAPQKLQTFAYRGIIIFIGIFIVYQFIKIIFSNTSNMLSSIIIFLIGIFIVVKLYGLYKNEPKN